KKMEKASEFAVLNAFSTRNSHLPGRLWDQMIGLEASEQTEDHNEVYTEAQELVNDWLDTKLKQELVSDGEGDAENTVTNNTALPETSGHLKYDKFDDLCGYLEEEEESTTVQKFMDHLLHKEVVDSGMLEDLGMKENQDKKEQKDPRLTMEMRHKQVKENRLRREKALQYQRTEKALKKSAFLEAQYLVQEEKRRKALEAKKEKEDIQREMVKLRREILERRRTVEETWKEKQQLATEYNRKRVLQHCFAEWHHWYGAEILKKELARAKEETRKKMDELLKAASLGKLNTSGSSGICVPEEATAMVDSPVRNIEVTAVPPLSEKSSLESNGCMLNHSPGRTTTGNLQGSLQNDPQNIPDSKQPKTLNVELSEQPGSENKLRTTRHKAEPVCVWHFCNRHVFQQQLIEKQKKKLQEQQKTILELKEKQRLAEAQWAVKHAAVVTDAQNRLLLKPQGTEEPKETCQMLPNMEDLIPMQTKVLIFLHSNLNQAQLKAQEEERQKREAEEKEAQLERKREEKRLKKMKEFEKQKRIKRNQELEAVAKEHYKKLLLRNKGLEPWKRLRMQSKQNTQYVTDLEEQVRKLCVHFLQKRIFRAWFTVVKESKIDAQSKHEISMEHSDRRILSQTFRTWKTSVKFMKEERLKEQRREQLRRKVAEILPDFQMLAPS
ncbi:Coiled-coil domain-containing protein, partial [Sciurus carolinensis]|nr:Coiled-coil domain-containing protein [Sciurus carolinensis]